MITTEELIKRVRCLINETEDDSGVSLITDDTRSIDDTIVRLMPQAVGIVQKQRNGRYVNVKSLKPGDVALGETPEGFKVLALPGDFTDLVSVRLASWKTSCIGISSPDCVELYYKLGKNSLPLYFTPMCVMDVAVDGAKVLKLFPCNDDDTAVRFVYEAEFDASEGLGMCDERMADAVAYVCAALLYNVFERYDAAKSFMSFAMALCGESAK